jgi:DNA-binding protein HU-beta/integration host factor subunit alpha
MTLTKMGLVVWISGKTGLTQGKVFDVLQKAFDHITDTLAKGGKVEIRNFGVFKVIIRKAKVGRDLSRAGIVVLIPPRARVKFKAGKDMKAAVLKLTPKPTRKAP